MKKCAKVLKVGRFWFRTTHVVMNGEGRNGKGGFKLQKELFQMVEMSRVRTGDAFGQVGQ
jgi:hypothetical protein